MPPFPTRRAPWWFHATLAIAVALLLRLYLPADVGADAARLDAARPLVAFLGFLIALGELIWKGIQVAGHVTLEVLHWMVVHLSLLVTKIGNGLRALGSDILKGLKRTWDFFKSVYTDVIKPALKKLQGWYDKFVHWLDHTFGPLLKHLKVLRDNLLKFWATYVRPWLDLIDVTRKALRVLSSLGVRWAKALDARLAKIEDAIQRPFRLLVAKLNEVINLVNRVITLDGLVQRVALLRSLERDYIFAWRAAINPWSKPLTDNDRKRRGTGDEPKTVPETITEIKALVSNGSGPNAALLDEMRAQWRIYLRS